MKKLLILLLLFLPFLTQAQSGEKSVSDSLIALLKEPALSDTQRVNQYNRIARQLDSERSPDIMIYANKALTLAKKVNYISGEATAYLMLGFGEESQSHFAAAIGYYEKSFQASVRAADTLAQAKALGNMSNAEYFIGDYTSAADHAMQAINHYENLKNYKGLVSCHIALGNVYADQKLYSDALQQYREAQVAAQHFPQFPDYEARPLASIGNVHQFRKDYDSSIWYYSKAMKSFEEIGAKAEMSICLNNMATARREQKQIDEAEDLLYRSLALRRAIGDTDGVCSIYQNLSGISADRQKYDSSLFFIRYALYLTDLTGSKSQRLDCYKGMAEAFSSLGKFDSAYRYLDQYSLLRDSLMNEESIDALGQLKTRYNDQKQESKLALIESAHQTEKAESARNIALLIGGILILLAVTGIVLYRYRVKQRLSSTLERKNVEITLQKKAITDSINYAKKIQDSILPPEHHVRKVIPDSFILYEPKDVVSGDFYWVEQAKGISIFAAVDCTGHGVPGALMSVVGFNLLNQAVNEMGLVKPSEILHHMDYGVNKLLRQSDEGNTVKDGMDLAVCAYDPQSRTLQYAGVFNPAYIVSKGQLHQIKADKFPIGINIDGKTDNYTNHTMQMHPGDMIYLFSDGYADQFGGQNGKKFMYKRFRELLVEIHTKTVDEQKEALRDSFMNWKGGFEQVDDILVIGVRVN